MSGMSSKNCVYIRNGSIFLNGTTKERSEMWRLLKEQRGSGESIMER